MTTPMITGLKNPINLASTAKTELILLSSSKSVTPIHTMTAPLNQSLFENLGNFINHYLRLMVSGAALQPKNAAAPKQGTTAILPHIHLLLHCSAATKCVPLLYIVFIYDRRRTPICRV